MGGFSGSGSKRVLRLGRSIGRSLFPPSNAVRDVPIASNDRVARKPDVEWGEFIRFIVQVIGASSCQLEIFVRHALTDVRVRLPDIGRLAD